MSVDFHAMELHQNVLTDTADKHERRASLSSFFFANLVAFQVRL